MGTKKIIKALKFAMWIALGGAIVQTLRFLIWPNSNEALLEVANFFNIDLTYRTITFSSVLINAGIGAISGFVGGFVGEIIVFCTRAKFGEK